MRFAQFGAGVFAGYHKGRFFGYTAAGVAAVLLGEQLSLGTGHGLEFPGKNNRFAV